MRPLEFLLNGLKEETGEILQAACKIDRFGLESLNRKTQRSNRADLVTELNDLQAMVNLLKEYLDDGRGGLPGLGDPEAIRAREEKFLRYAAESRRLGRLEDEPPTA